MISPNEQPEEGYESREVATRFVASQGRMLLHWLKIFTEETRFVCAAVAMVLIHAGFMLYGYGWLPTAPFYGDEIIIHDAAIALARGHGYIATSFSGSNFAVDKVFSHFPPLYPLVTAATFRLFGVSVYSMRLTTTVMSIASTAALAALLLYLCRSRLLARQTALLVLAIYCTTAPLILLERVARMESMIALLVIVATSALFVMILRGRRGPFLWPAVTAIFASATCLAVHPESITALALFAGLLLFAVPGRLQSKVIALCAACALPVLFLIVFFGKQILAAAQQFFLFFLYRIPDDTLLQWLSHLVRPSNSSQFAESVFLLEIVLLLTIPAAIHLARRGKESPDTLAHRLGRSLCVAAFLEWLVLLFFLHAGVRRYEFLFGPLLILNAMYLLGASPLRRYQSVTGWTFVAINLIATLNYLSTARQDPADRDPERFQAVLKRIPMNVSVVASSSLWLDLQEDNRPFSCLYPGIDGQGEWQKTSANPLQRFDVVLLSSEDRLRVPRDRDAAEGRHRYTFPVGSHSVDVYLRDGIMLNP